MTVHLERRDRIATLTIDRPPLNILDLETIARLNEALATLAEDPDLQLLQIQGAGPRAFSAGVAVQDHTPDRVGQMLEGLHGAVRRLRDLDAVTLAVVRGHCLGGGMELALSCDLLLAADDAHFGQPEVKLGCYPPVAAALYPKLLGAARTLELLLTGRTLDCEEAERLGIVTWRVPSEALEEKLPEIVQSLTQGSAAVTRLLKRSVHAGRDLPFREALAETERIYLEDLCPLEDMAEGVAAFLEKRPAVWRHR
jgi:cyclohexa-1,5-dienecarbonyl-CoA hydratase